MLGINTERAKHPNMADAEQRVRSFNNWPSASRQDPNVLAAAGFFYAGMYLSFNDIGLLY